MSLKTAAFIRRSAVMRKFAPGNRALYRPSSEWLQLLGREQEKTTFRIGALDQL